MRKRAGPLRQQFRSNIKALAQVGVDCLPHRKSGRHGLASTGSIRLPAESRNRPGVGWGGAGQERPLEDPAGARECRLREISKSWCWRCHGSRLTRRSSAAPRAGVGRSSSKVEGGGGGGGEGEGSAGQGGAASPTPGPHSFADRFPLEKGALLSESHPFFESQV